MHCGMGSSLYDDVYTRDGTVMRDALTAWYDALVVGMVTPVPRESRRWVDTDDYVEADGRCWGYMDGWVPFFRTIFLMWCLWAVHLTQTLRGGTNVSAAFQYGAIFLAGRAGKMEKLPQAWGGRENMLSWLAAFVFLFLVMLLDRYVL